MHAIMVIRGRNFGWEKKFHEIYRNWPRKIVNIESVFNDLNKLFCPDLVKEIRIIENSIRLGGSVG